MVPNRKEPKSLKNSFTVKKDECIFALQMREKHHFPVNKKRNQQKI